MQERKETWVPSSWEGPLEEGMATHSSIFAWRIPWTVHKSQTRLKGLSVHALKNKLQGYSVQQGNLANILS